ncbi:MAG: hypothetical protein AB7I30_00450 [Isosphaeraceae bacterium]
MTLGTRPRWALALRRGAISAFVVFHLGATVLWILPDCPIRRQTAWLISYYVQPLGMLQYWGMFAPDPVRDTLTLEAEAIDAQGLRHGFVFERVADHSWWEGVPRYRHSKFVANLAIHELEFNRVIAARQVARALALPASAYPLTVSLFHRVVVTPVPGGPPPDPMTPSHTRLMGIYPILDQKEVFP